MIAGRVGERVLDRSELVAPVVSDLRLAIPRIGNALQTMEVVVAVVGRQGRQRAATIRIGLG
jgi:hypothetical protein